MSESNERPMRSLRRAALPNEPQFLGGISPEESALDPSPWLNRLREETGSFQSGDGSISFTRYDDCVQVLRDHRLGRTEAALDIPVPAIKTFMRNFLMLNPPDHTRLRGIVTKAFTPPALARMRGRVEQIAEELCDGLPDQADDGVVELVTAYARPFPTTVIAEVLGVPMSDSTDFMRWSKTLIATLDANPLANANPMELLQAASEFVDYMRVLIAKRREEPADDVISVLAAAEADGTASEDEAIAAAMLLLIAGHETTVNLIGMGTNDLMRFRDQWDRLVADPALARTLPDELLRFDGPVTITGRMAFEDVEIGDVVVPAGTFAAAFVAAANRDPRQFADPDTLDIGRSPNPHLAFASGIHFCLGAGLARMEAEVAFAALARRYPSMQAAGDPAPRPSWALRGLVSMPVTLA